jgi:hypothetical protein
MATLTLRQSKGSPLTFAEVDGNFTALNNELAEKALAVRTISVGTGLSGGGSLASDRTISLSAGSIASLGLADSAVQPARTISAGTGLSGGGALTADRTISLSAGSIASLGLADSAVQPARTISAGTGLSGGGALTADRTISLSAGSIASLGLADSAVQPARTISAGTGLTGGGNLSADRTVTLGTPSSCSPSTSNATTSTSHTHAITGTVPDSRTVSAGSGLSGGGDLSANRTLSIATGGITNAMVSASAAIAGTKISPNFGNQTITIGDSGNTAQIVRPAAGTLTFIVGGNEIARLNSSGGNLFVGGDENTNADTTAIFRTRADGETRIASAGIALTVNRLTTDGNVQVFRRQGVQVGRISVTESATSYITSSDYRLKENVGPLTDALDRVKQLKPYRFNFVATPEARVDGFFAHEVAPVVPEAVSGEKDAEEYQGMDHSKLVPLLTAALQAAILRIEALEEAALNP